MLFFCRVTIEALKRFLIFVHERKDIKRRKCQCFVEITGFLAMLIEKSIQKPSFKISIFRFNRLFS